MITVLSFVAYTAFVAIVSWRLTRRDELKSAEGYYLAGRSLNGWVIAGSLVMTNLSTEHLIGLNADSYRYSIAVMAWETTAAIAMVLMALYFLPIYLRRGIATIPQFLADRYDQSTQLIATVLLLISYAAAILPIVLLLGANGLEELFNVSATWGVSREVAVWILVWGAGLLGAAYAVLGGLKAVAISDAVNGVGFLLVGLLVPYLALKSIGYGDPLAGLAEVYSSHPDKFDVTGDEAGSFLPFNALFTGMVVNQLFFWCTNQTIVQRTFGARSLAEGQKGVCIAAFFKLLGPLIVVLPGVIAYHLFRDELGEQGATLAYPRLVKYALPPALAGFAAAVMVGAVLTTFNSVLNSAATLVSLNIYRPLFRPDADERRLVRIGRASTVIMALAAMTVAPAVDAQGSLYERLQQINATFFGPMLAVIFLGLFTRWATPLAAKCALVAGPLAFFAVVFAWNEPTQRWLRAALDLDADVHFLHFLGAVFVATVAGMAVVSAARPARYALQEPAQPAVDMQPWRFIAPAGILLIAATIACYAALAR